MNNKPRQLLKVTFLFVYLISSSLSFPVMGVVLKDMEAVTKPDGVVELKLLFDGPAPDVKGYSVERPPRVAIDLPDTVSAVKKYNALGFDVADKVTILQSGKNARLVINQKIPASFESRSDGSIIYVSIGASVNKQFSSDSPSSDLSSYYTGSSAAYGMPSVVEPKSLGQISLIDFQRGDEGEGNIVLTMSSADMPMDINEDAGKIKLKFKGDILPERLRNRLDVTDFGTQVKYINAEVKNGYTIIEIEPKVNYDYLAYQSENKIIISVKTLSESKYSKKNKGLSYKGEKLSFNFQDIEMRAVLQLIADFTELNLVASDTVSGNVTLRLKNVPWDQALDIILQSKGLGKRIDGNILTVAPAEEIAAREKQQLENEKQIRELAPVFTEHIIINYAEAGEIAKVLSGDGGESLLTVDGSVQVVERTNSLLIKDTQSKLDDIKDLLKLIDIPVRQVLIEARIVVLSSTFRKELGVKWSGGGVKSSNNRDIIFGGKKTNLTLPGGGDSFDKTGLRTDLVETLFDGNNVFTDLGVSATTATSIGIGFVTNGTILNLELSALLSDGGGEVISQPKIVTADKQKAVIKAGKKIPYNEASSSGAATIAFQDAVLSMEVTPQITPDGRVIMDIKITNDDATETAANGVPIIDKNEITTKVLVNDSETVVLGGVFKQTKKSSVNKVPILGDLPFIGALFRRTVKSDDKNELMVFITPRVIKNEFDKR